MRVVTLICAVSMVAAASSAAAQDPSARATAGEISRSAGFTPDPITVSIYSGGDVDVSRSIGGSCVGSIADAPDYEFTYDAGSWPLTFAVESDQDTSLIINGPDGEWYCIDDTEGLNPVLRWGDPPSGTYDIWVGAVGEPGRSTLYITENN